MKMKKLKLLKKLPSLALVRLVLFILILLPFQGISQVVLKVDEVPKFTPNGESIFVTGTFNNWQVADSSFMLAFDSTSSTWEISLPKEIRSFEYNFSRGSNLSMEANALGEVEDKRVYIAPLEASDTVLVHKIEKWSDLASDVTIRLKSIPLNTPSEAKIFLAADFNDWNIADSTYLVTNKNGVFEVVIPAQIDSFHYKFTRGSWSSVEGGYSGGFRPNRFYSKKSDKPETIAVIISSWEDLSENVLSLYSFIGLVFSTVGLLILSMLFSIDRGGQTYVQTLFILILLYTFAFIIKVMSDDAELFSVIPHVYLLPDLLWFSYGPLYLFFVYQMIKREIDQEVKPKWYWWSGGIIHFCLLLPLLIKPTEELKSSIINQEYSDQIYLISFVSLLFNVLIWLKTYHLIQKASRYGAEALPIFRIKLLKRLQWIFLAILVVWSFSFLIGIFDFYSENMLLPYVDVSIKMTWLMLGLPSVFITYYALKYPSLLKRKIGILKTPKEASPTSFSNDILKFKYTLEHLIKDEKIYLNPTLTMKEVATMIGTNTHTLSHLINESYKKNFNDYINSHRIKEFIHRVSNAEEESNFSELSVEVGFNSKSTFNRAFKKVTGFTPRAYFKQTVEN
ncbi:AraC-like DNA-binding protein [Sediminitomix flava]|uniref:AraC-like DNA-binding protein n=2 Tax=Sediminitomix flava TaxID=379075 RepID=A0A315YXY6_SEDFL|nr:AraC-like DNA-binding protein [Sediminitomix flava]